MPVQWTLKWKGALLSGLLLFLYVNYVILTLVLIYLCFLQNFGILLSGLAELIKFIVCLLKLFGNAVQTAFPNNSKFFFWLKFNMFCMFWIVLMCWCQKWFLKNEKTSLACISAWKVIWKATATTLPNTKFNMRYTEAVLAVVLVN